MEKEDIANIKLKYEQYKQLRLEILKLEDAIETCKQDPMVIKYLGLIEQYQNYSNKTTYDYSEMTNKELLDKAVSNTTIHKTNNIYVCMGTYARNIEYDSKDYRVDMNDPRADYKVYRNLELSPISDNYEIEIPINECIEFEKKNKIIFSRINGLNEEYYNRLREEFFETVINEGQEKAISEVLRKK